MVNLVNARRKAKEKKQKDEQEALATGQARETEAPSSPETQQEEPPAAGTPAAEPSSPIPPVPSAATLGVPVAAPMQPAVTPVAEAGVGERRTRSREQASAAAVDRLEEFRRTAGTRREIVGEAATDEIEAEADQLELLVFHVAEEQYAVEISSILEITRPRSITRVPNAEASVLGIMSLRGTIVTILDVRRRLGHRSVTSTDDEQRIIVVERESEVAGFVVDRVYRVVRVDASKVESHPVVSSNEQNRCVRGVFRHRERITILLALDQLLERDS